MMLAGNAKMLLGTTKVLLGTTMMLQGTARCYWTPLGVTGYFGLGSVKLSNRLFGVEQY